MWLDQREILCDKTRKKTIKKIKQIFSLELKYLIFLIIFHRFNLFCTMLISSFRANYTVEFYIGTGPTVPLSSTHTRQYKSIPDKGDQTWTLRGQYSSVISNSATSLEYHHKL